MLLLLCCLGALPAAASSGDFDPVELVNPLMGSQSVHQFSAGNTYPAVATPWGMNFWTPQTGKMGDGWAYTYTDTRIRADARHRSARIRRGTPRELVRS